MISNKLASHLRVDRYGEFRLAEAIRPSLDLQVIPRQGYRVETYADVEAGLRVPALAASVLRERLFETFLNLLQPLSEVVNVVLETSHEEKVLPIKTCTAKASTFRCWKATFAISKTYW